MNDNKIGLKSLSEQVKQMQKDTLSVAPDTFEGKLITKKKEKEFEKQREKVMKLSNTKSHFKANLLANLEDEKNINLTNLPKIIEYAVLYVEKNADKIAEIVETVVDSEFKLDTCINLIMDLIQDIDISLLISMINEIVYLLFNKEKHETQLKRKKSNLEGKQSLSKKTGKHLFSCFNKKKD